MNIQEKIDESKKRTQLMNGVTIDWQYAQQIIPNVLPIIARDPSIPNIEQFDELCHTLYNLFNNIESNIKNLKEMIPVNSSQLTTSLE